MAMMSTPPQKGWEVAVSAQELGRAHELGGYRHSYEARRGGRQWGWGLFLALAGVMIVLPAGAGVTGAGRAVVFGIAAAMVALGITLTRIAPRQRIDRIFVYDGGVAQVIDGEGAPRVIRWNGLGPVVKSYTPGGEDYEPMLAKIVMSGTDGTAITAGRLRIVLGRPAGAGRGSGGPAGCPGHG